MNNPRTKAKKEKKGHDAQRHKAMLIILDGWGIREETKDNAVKLAKTPNFKKYWDENPHTTLYAAQEHVGLPHGFIGNSEVGHLNLGAGRLVLQDLLRIDNAIKDRSFFRNPVLLKAMKNAQKRPLHLLGLVSDGGVHSHVRHLYALLEMAKNNGVKDVRIHCFLDGRDVPPKSALKYISEIEGKCRKIGVGKIATVIGRFYSMDRDNRWNREHKAYEAMAEGKGLTAKSARQAIINAYARGETDEFVRPTIITKRDAPTKHVAEGDSLIFFNFRQDRARELTKAFVEGEFKNFRRRRIMKLDFVCLTQYDQSIHAPAAFPPEIPRDGFGETLSKAGLTQFRIAETEKYAHVTYFFNGGKEGAFKGEDRLLIPSPRISTYDKKPSMSAFKVTEDAVKALNSGKYDFALLNYANPDMVGHTGKLKETIQAVEVVDACLGKLVYAARKNGYQVIIVADHGNAEEMAGIHQTSHTLNKVPCILLADERYSFVGGKRDSIAQMGPTMLMLMGIPAPKVHARPLIRRV